MCFTLKPDWTLLSEIKTMHYIYYTTKYYSLNLHEPERLKDMRNDKHVLPNYSISLYTVCPDTHVLPHNDSLLHIKLILYTTYTSDYIML